MRTGGILMHLTSLPSPYGVGTMGACARQFVDFLQAAGHLIKKIFAGVRQKASTETGDCAVVGSLLPGKQPHKVNVTSACRFNLSG